EVADCPLPPHKAAAAVAQDCDRAAQVVDEIGERQEVRIQRWLSTREQKAEVALSIVIGEPSAEGFHDAPGQPASFAIVQLLRTIGAAMVADGRKEPLDHNAVSILWVAKVNCVNILGATRGSLRIGIDAGWRWTYGSGCHIPHAYQAPCRSLSAVRLH